MFLSYFVVLTWVIALIVIMSVGIPIMIGIIDQLTGDIQIVKELKKKNTAVAIVLASAILGICILIGLMF